MNKFQVNKLQELGFSEYQDVAGNWQSRINIRQQERDTNRKKLTKLKREISKIPNVVMEFKREFNNLDKNMLGKLDQLITLSKDVDEQIEGNGIPYYEENLNQLKLLRNQWSFSIVFYPEDEDKKNESWINFLTILLYQPTSEADFNRIIKSRTPHKFWEKYKKYID